LWVPLLIPYGYDEFNKGAENLYPYHYTLEDTQRVNDEIVSRTQSDVVDVDEMIAQAKAEAEKKGEKFTKKDEAVIRAKAKVAAKPSEDSSEEQSVDEDSVRKELGIKKHIFGYSQAELERKANGEKVFPMYLVLTCMAVIFWSVLCMVPVFPCLSAYSQLSWYW